MYACVQSEPSIKKTEIQLCQVFLLTALGHFLIFLAGLGGAAAGGAAVGGAAAGEAAAGTKIGVRGERSLHTKVTL